MKLFLKTYRSRQFFHIHIVFFFQLHYLLYNSVSQIKMPVSVQLSVAHFKEARGGVGVGVCVCSSRCECMAGGWWWEMLGEDVLDVLPWTLSALVVGGAAAGRGHVITGHTAPVTTTRDQTIVHG